MCIPPSQKISKLPKTNKRGQETNLAIISNIQPSLQLDAVGCPTDSSSTQALLLPLHHINVHATLDIARMSSLHTRNRTWVCSREWSAPSLARQHIHVVMLYEHVYSVCLLGMFTLKAQNCDLGCWLLVSLGFHLSVVESRSRHMFERLDVVIDVCAPKFRHEYIERVIRFTFA